jgi:hypothetical protein
MTIEATQKQKIDAIMAVFHHAPVTLGALREFYSTLPPNIPAMYRQKLLCIAADIANLVRAAEEVGLYKQKEEKTNG